VGRVQRLPLFDGAGVFAPDVLRSELDIEHGGRKLGMAISCCRAGKDIPARTISVPNVCRTRWGLA